jgi:hypothetical protein
LSDGAASLFGVPCRRLVGFGIAVGGGGAVDVLSISNVTAATIEGSVVVYVGGNGAADAVIYLSII